MFHLLSSSLGVPRVDLRAAGNGGRPSTPGRLGSAEIKRLNAGKQKALIRRLFSVLAEFRLIGYAFNLGYSKTVQG